MFRKAATLAVISVIAFAAAGAAMAMEDEVAALVIDNGSGMVPARVASISRDDMSDCQLTPTQFFSRKFSDLDAKQHRFIVCTKSASNPALFVAFQAANTTKNGALSEHEFNSYKSAHSMETDRS